VRTSRSALAVVVAVLCAQLATADELKDDALPKGAKLRLGAEPFTSRFSPSAVPLPPEYRAVLVPDSVNGFRRFDIATGKPLDAAKGGAPTGSGVIISGNGQRAVLATTGILTVRDTATGKAVKELKPPMGFTTLASATAPPVSFSGDGKFLAQGGPGRSGKGEVLVWDVDKGATVAEITVDQRVGVIPVLSFDGTLLATRPMSIQGAAGGKDDENNRAVRVWDVGTKKERFKARVALGGTQINACAFSPDGEMLAVSAADGPVDLWDVKTGKVKRTFLGRTGQGHRVAFSADSRALAALAQDGTIQRWSTETGKALGTTEPPLEMPLYGAHWLAFADKDRLIAWGQIGSAWVAWEAPSGKLLTRPTEHTSGIRSIAFADGGKQIVTAPFIGKVVRWDATTGKSLGPVTVRAGRASSQGVTGLALAPDGAHAAAGSAPAAVFDLKTGAELFAIPRHPVPGFLTSVILTADAESLVTIAAPSAGTRAANGTLVLWDLATRTKVVEIELPVYPGSPSAALSPSGARLVVARYVRTADGTKSVLTVTGYDAKTGKKLGEIEDPNAGGPVFVAAASETAALVSSGNGRLRAFDFVEGKGGDEIEPNGRGEAGGPVGPVVPTAATPVLFAPDGKRFAFGVMNMAGDSFGVRIYDWPGGKSVHTFTGHRAPVTALTFAPDGKTLASGSADTTVLLWDLTKIGAR